MPNNIKHIIGSVCRTLLGLTFIFSGFVKAVDPLGTTYKIEDYLTLGFGGVFQWATPLAEVAAWVLICFEFLLGICLLLNIRTQWTSWLALAMMLVMTPLTLYIAIANPVTDCGCFGDAIVVSNWTTFWKNIVLLTLVIILLLTRRHIPQTLQNRAELVVTCIALAGVLGFMLYNRLHLPVIDFRPYKTGNNIPLLMEYPEDAEPDQYEILLVYEKDGVKETFTLQDYPRNDSTWTFVDQQSKLIKKGYEPPIHDFEPTTLYGDNLTDEILEADQATLIVMYDLKKANLKQMSKVLTLLASQAETGNPCYILTGSGEDDIISFIERVNEEVQAERLLTEDDFCQNDPIALKTIIRANPGVVVIENGIVKEKYNLRNR